MNTSKADEPLVLTDELRRIVQRAEQGDRSALPELRKLLDSNPSLWRRYGDLAATAELAWLELACGTNLALRESITRRLAELRRELGSEAASPLERLLVDRVVAGWVQVHYADINLAQLRGSADAERIRLATHLLDRAQQRYLNAVKQLATVRKLLKPALSPYELATRHDRPARGGRLSPTPEACVGVVN